MNSLERFYATIDRREVDHPATWLGMPDPASLPGLFREYGVSSLHALKHAVGEDIYAVEPPYRGEDRVIGEIRYRNVEEYLRFGN